MSEARFSNNGRLPNRWESVSLAEITAKIADRDHYTPNYVEDGELMVSPKDFDEDGRINFTNCQMISSIEHTHNRRKTDISPGDLVFTRIGARLGKACLVTPQMPEFSLLHSAVMIRPAPQRVLPEFLLYVLKGHEIQSQLGREIQSIGVPDLGLDKINAFIVTLPPLSEQRKIARILTTLDNLIEKTEALIAKYQSIKQGMMNDLFTRGVDAHSQLRPLQGEAPDLYKQSEMGWIPTEWQQRSIGSICTWMSGGTPSKSNPSYWSGQIPWISPKDMKRFEIEDSEDHISEEAARVGTRMVPPGTVLIVIRGMILAHSFPVCLTTGSVTFNQDIKALAKNGTVCERFLAYWLVAHASQMIALATESTHGTKRFDMDDLQSIQLGLPSPDEQQKIVNRLDKLAWTQDVEQKHLKKLTKIKTGLMQDLLTGKVRVMVGEAESVSTHA